MNSTRRSVTRHSDARMARARAAGRGRRHGGSYPAIVTRARAYVRSAPIKEFGSSRCHRLTSEPCELLHQCCASPPHTVQYIDWGAPTHLYESYMYRYWNSVIFMYITYSHESDHCQIKKLVLPPAANQVLQSLSVRLLRVDELITAVVLCRYLAPCDRE